MGMISLGFLISVHSLAFSDSGYLLDISDLLLMIRGSYMVKNELVLEKKIANNADLHFIGNKAIFYNEIHVNLFLSEEIDLGSLGGSREKNCTTFLT